MNHERIVLEVCANSASSAVAAQQGGALRVELCENLQEGGTTPSYGQIRMARRQLDIQLYVLIRPRPGDFLYGTIEYEVMKEDVRHCIAAGCDGIVIGMLQPDGSIDKNRCGELAGMAKAHGLGVSFHRAFDLVSDTSAALESIIDLGCHRILTSGSRPSALEGAAAIAQLVQQAAGRISIMPGGGIGPHNVAELIRLTGAREVHASARSRISSPMEFIKEGTGFGAAGPDQYSYELTDAAIVRDILAAAGAL